MEGMTDYQLNLILQLIISNLEKCQSMDDLQKAIVEIKEMKK